MSAHDPGPSPTTPPAVVLGGGITGLGVLRSLGRARLRPFLACEPYDFAGRSRWVRGRTLRIRESVEPDSLIGGLECLGLRSAVLIPCSDVWCQAVAALPDSVRSRYLSSTPTRQVLGKLLDKWSLAQTLERNGVAHPLTHDLIDETIPSPHSSFFLKPRDSQAFYQVYGYKAIRLNDSRAAIEAVDSISRAGLTAIFQEHIPGPATAYYLVDGFIDRTGVIRARLTRRRIRMFPTDFGNTTMTVSIPPEIVRDAFESVERLLTRIGYRGAYSAEFKRDPRDGIDKLLEINCRPWWYIGFAVNCGVDIPMMIYRDALGLPVRSAYQYATGKRQGFLRDDVRAYRRLHAESDLGLRRWLDSWVGATDSALTIDDSLPGLASLFPLVRQVANDLVGRSRARLSLVAGRTSR